MQFLAAEKFGPFEDCTSNQVIAYSALQEKQHDRLLEESARLAKAWLDNFNNVSVEQLAVDISLVKLSIRMVPHIRGYIHVQINPFHSYSTLKAIENAQRIVDLVRHVSPDFDTSHICIKIPSTWEGLQACRVLEASGIRTLATTIFTLEQAALAAEVGCLYVAPYVNEIKVFVDDDFHDDNPQPDLCVLIQRYYQQFSLPTKVLAATLTTRAEVMAVSGVHHMTIAPPLLQELSQTKASESYTEKPSLFEEDVASSGNRIPSLMNFLDDEAGFRLALSRNSNGVNEGKLIQVRLLYTLYPNISQPLKSEYKLIQTRAIQAINVFCDMQQNLESMAKERMLSIQ
ncbi:MAG: hypothetical protein Q9187_005100 [Circinaria calcarea]